MENINQENTTKQKDTDELLERLALAVHKGFEAIDEKFEKIEKKINQGFKEVDQRFDKVDERLDLIKNDVLDIKLRLDNCAYTFEVRENTKRIENLEVKVNGLVIKGA